MLFRNDGGNRNRFVRVRPIGTRSNRDGIGARVTVTRPDGHTPVAPRAHRLELLLPERHRADLRAGGQHKATSIEVVWPSGQVDRIGEVLANHVVWVKEGEGLVAAKGLPERGSAFVP